MLNTFQFFQWHNNQKFAINVFFGLIPPKHTSFQNSCAYFMNVMKTETNEWNRIFHNVAVVEIWHNST